MDHQLRSASVIGAGVMGAGIAAHLANAGIPTLLLDVVPPGSGPSRPERDALARRGLQRALEARPPAFYSPRLARLITCGNVEDDLPRAADADWVIEAIVERLPEKQALYERLEGLLSPGTMLSSNTSGLPLRDLIAGRSPDLRRRFLITHFFNPVRYMKLLEVVPGAETEGWAVDAVRSWAAEHLGKGVVIARDTPGFIANRIGIYGFLAAMRLLEEGAASIETLDAVFGPPLGRPRSAIFRTADISGLDVLVHVADNLYAALPDDLRRETFRVPAFMRELVARGWLGEKSGQGFYKRVKGPDGESQILTLDLRTMEYRPQERPRLAALAALRDVADPAERIRRLADAGDPTGQLAWRGLADTLTYTAAIQEEIAHDEGSVDDAMRWGFNWELGVYETWDALGVRRSVERMQAEGYAVPPRALELAARDGRFTRQAPERQPVVLGNDSASLTDLGEGVACLEFHSKLNTIDAGLVEMIVRAVEGAGRDFRALVVANDGADFSVGANLMLVLMAAQAGRWAELEATVRAFQQANLALKYAPLPVVVAPAGRTLGGGCEIVLHGHLVRAAAETYLGLVEVGTGLVPAGGGCKEMLLRCREQSAEGGPFPAVRRAFELIGMAATSSSAEDAREMGYLRPTDRVTLDRARLRRDARADALELAARGTYQPPERPTFTLPGPGGRLVLEQNVAALRKLGRISEHDAVVAGALARVLTGGDCSPLDTLTELQVLDLEREAFLHLCGLPKTQARMQSVLEKGRPLRN